MAYAALLCLARVIDEILPFENDYTCLCGKEHMTSLHQNIISLQHFLEVVPPNDASTTTQLEGRLIDVVYRLEDLIESNLKDSPSDQLILPEDASVVFCRYTEEINSILQEAKHMEELFKQNKKREPQATRSSKVEPGSNQAKVGINEDLMRVIARVTNIREKSLQIIPIVGMGGIGKTTLARAVYEDESIVSKFDLCFWVTISQEYNIQEILEGLLEGQKLTPESTDDSQTGQKSTPESTNDSQTGQKSAPESTDESQTGQKSAPESTDDSQTGKKSGSLNGKIPPKKEPLDTKVRKRLFNQRFLIVLDDMWKEEAWQGVLSAIPDNGKGSRVILTTRSSIVATKVDSSTPQHKMQLLNTENSWNLLRGVVQGQEISKSMTSMLKDVGRRIAEKCDGLPLTLIVVGGLLKSNMSMDYWEEVERNITEAASRDGQLDAVLSLSYNNLPPHLKSCFLYMGAFPEDFRIPTSHLLRLWVAEGFVKPDPHKGVLEEIAEEYLEDLVERNLVMVAARRSSGKIRTCMIHDVPRELSLKIAKEDKFLGRFERRCISDVIFENITTSQRHVSFSTKSFSSFHKITGCNTFTRSLILIDCPAALQLTYVAARFRLIKVLYGVRINSNSMYSQLFELTNLRLLHFYHFYGSSGDVPKSIIKLQKLETLMAEASSHLSFPVEIWKMAKLRHIHLRKRCTLHFPVNSRGYPVLESLQTLIMSGQMISSGSAIRRMPNLMKFNAYNHYFDFSKLCAKIPGEPAEIRCKPEIPCKLKRLHIRGRMYYEFPCSLQKLCLQSTGISSWELFSSIVRPVRPLSKLPNLQVLKLKYGSVSGDKWETKEDDFPCLKYLELSGLSLREWSTESEHFPCLETLFISDMDCLEIPSEIGDISKLTKLIVSKCGSKVNDSAEKIREEQEGNGELQVTISK